MKIGFIGIGHMGGAILFGYAGTEAAKGNELLAFSRNEGRARTAKEKVAALQLCSSGRELCSKSDIIVLGVKPKDMEEALAEIAPAWEQDKMLISMAAGVDMEFLQKKLAYAGSKVIRIMPNTPAQVGEAMTSLSRNKNVSEQDFVAVKQICESIGRAEEVDEALIDCVIGVSGSSPAYTYMFIEALIEAAKENGMPDDKARIFAAQSVMGAAKMVLDEQGSPKQLRLDVCSPNGTTVEAVDKLLANGFMDKVKEGFQAAVDRSAEMTATAKK